MEKHRFVASRGLEQLVQEAGDRELAPELLPMVVPCARDALMVQEYAARMAARAREKGGTGTTDGGIAEQIANSWFLRHLSCKLCAASGAMLSVTSEGYQNLHQAFVSPS